MLKSLFIQNFVLIDNLDIEFTDGFSVISGETGAGKSIILGALSLVLGQRADSKSIKQGADKCVIEATFAVAEYDFANFFEENDMEYDSTTCILRRELYSSGKSRAFVNDSPVSLAVMKELGTRLIDIHSQHQNLILGDSAFQLRVVDILMDDNQVLCDYGEVYSNYIKLKKQLHELKEKAEQTRQEEDYVRFQLEQLEGAKLSEGEQELLEQEQELLTHAEEIKGVLCKIEILLSRDEIGVVQSLKTALSNISSLLRCYPEAKGIEERLRTVYIDMNDLAAEVASRQEEVEYSPVRIEQVNQRLDIIYTLEQKHRVSSLEELIALRQQYCQQLQEIDSFDEQVLILEKQVLDVYNNLVSLAKSISTSRRQAATELEKALVQTVKTLGIPNVRFCVDFTTKKEPDIYGIDDVCFLFSANKNGELYPVSETASGGEVSRLMLCLKALIADSMALPSIIFDEVDMGVSGDIADKMGNIMYNLGRQMQVIAITHLPQIAAKGSSHYLVYKQDADLQTATYIRCLTDGERITEIARMLSGASLTDAAVANARELLGLGNNYI